MTKIRNGFIGCLILILLFLVPGCGSTNLNTEEASTSTVQEEEGDPFSVLISDQWVEALGGTNTMAFMDDGSGKTNHDEFNWKLDDNLVTISREPENYEDGMVVSYPDTVFSLNKTEEGYQLISDENQRIYVMAGELEAVQNSIREAAVLNAVNVDLAELFSIAENNEAKAVQQYEGKLGKVVVNAMNIRENYFDYTTAEYGGMKSIMVYLPTSVLAELSNGEQIQVVGQLANINSSGFSVINAFIIDNYVPNVSFTDEEIADSIEQFGDDGDGHITWSEGSFPFFMNNRLLFTLVEGSEAESLLCSTKWNAKYYAQPELKITLTFKEDGSLIETEDGHENKWDWKIAGGLEFPTGTRRNYEIRKVNDNTLVFYQNDAQYSPEWVLYK